MKYKINLKLLFFIASIVSLIITIVFIQITYARYVTSLTAKSNVELGTWSIKENRKINRKRREFKNKDYWGKKPEEN